MNTAEASNSDVDDERGPCQARPGEWQMPNPTPARSDAFATPSQRLHRQLPGGVSTLSSVQRGSVAVGTRPVDVEGET